MLARLRRSVTLFVLDAGDTGKAAQRAEPPSLFIWTAGDAHAPRSCVFVVQGLIQRIDRAEAGIDIGQFGQPLVARARFEDSAQHLYRLLTLFRTGGYVEGQQFQMSDMRAECMPEFIFERGQRDVLAVSGFVDV